MLSRASILYGAVVAGVALAALARPRQLTVILTGVLATAGGSLAWNAILRATQASQFFTDAPLRLLPASWQDTGSGVSALAAPPCSSGSGPLAAAPARRTVALAALCGLAAFLVDVYLTDQPGLDGCHPGRGGGDGAAWRRGVSVRRARRMPAGRQLTSTAAWASLLIAGCRCPRRRPVRSSAPARLATASAARPTSTIATVATGWMPPACCPRCAWDSTSQPERPTPLLAGWFTRTTRSSCGVPDWIPCTGRCGCGGHRVAPPNGMTLGREQLTQRLASLQHSLRIPLRLRLSAYHPGAHTQQGYSMRTEA
jgi:hypothetical protein